MGAGGIDGGEGTLPPDLSVIFFYYYFESNVTKNKHKGVKSHNYFLQDLTEARRFFLSPPIKMVRPPP